MTKYTVKVIDSLKDFHNLERIWNSLYSRKNFNIFSSFQWYDSWCTGKIKTQEDLSPKIILIEKSGQIEGIIPLMDGDNNELTFLSSSAADYQDFIIPNPNTYNNLEDIIGQILKKTGSSALRLEEVSEKSELFLFLNRRHQSLSVKRYPTSVCPRLNLLSTIPFKNESLRRKLRKISLLGKISVNHYYSKEGITEELSSFKKQFFLKWGKNPKSSFFFKPFDDMLIANLASNLSKYKSVLLSKLSLDRKPISYYFGFLNHDLSYDFYRSSYDQKYRKYSPGHIMLNYLIEHLRAKGYKIFDFLRGEYDYKKYYADGKIQNHGYLIRKKK